MTHALPMQYITDIPALRALADAIRQADWVALDTEFMREKTYYPQLCLLQLATKDIIACVDPLALEDLTPLYDALFDPGIVKVLHAARQDYEIFSTPPAACPRRCSIPRLPPAWPASATRPVTPRWSRSCSAWS